MCQLLDVSRSGYYYWKKVAQPKFEAREAQDQQDFELIRHIYQYKGYPKGSRTIQLMLRQRRIIMNRKKILRLMKKFGLMCPIRKPNRYRMALKTARDSQVAPHLVQREFKAYGPRKILLTDITYLYYTGGKRAYLSTIKDGFTNEILAYKVSDSLKINFVLETVEALVDATGMSLDNETIIHSDQGVHYTSLSFRQLLKEHRLIQSMSRRGNCWDNAPQESFFGHMKDEMNLTQCKSLAEVQEMIDDYMFYYNHERPQWNLAKLTPRQYYDYSVTQVYPIDGVEDVPELPQVRTREVTE